MTRLVAFNDVHFSKTEPECRASSYPLEILEKLQEVAALARRLGAPAVACSGDWLHRKGRATFGEANDLLGVLAGWRASGLEVLGILGNHDLADGLASIDARAAGALFHSRVLQLLDFAPWTHSDGDGTLHVTGTSYFHGCDATPEARI